MEEQSAHGTPTAGAVYARGIEEAPGHVESRRAEYRAVSEEWHSLLGVASEASKENTPSQKRKAIDSSEDATPAKRLFTKAEVQERIQAEVQEQRLFTKAKVQEQIQTEVQERVQAVLL